MTNRIWVRGICILVAGAVVGATVLGVFHRPGSAAIDPGGGTTYEPRQPIETSGFSGYLAGLEPWEPDASLSEISDASKRAPSRGLARVNRELEKGTGERVPLTLMKASLSHYHGKADEAYEELKGLRALIEGIKEAKEKWLFTVIYYQGVTALRVGENDNCIACRG